MTDLARHLGRRPRVLIVTAYFPPMGGGGVIRMAKLTKYLVEFGWDVTVITSDEQLDGLRDDGLAGEIPGTVMVHHVQGPFRLLWRQASSIVASPSATRRGGAVVRFAKAAVRSILIPDRWIGWAWRVSRSSREFAGAPDVVLSSGPPHSVHLAAGRLSRRLRVPFVMDIRDDWADNPLHASRAPWRNPIDRALERWCISRAAHVVVVSEPSRRGYVARHPRLASRSTVITNGFDPADIPTREAAPREKGAPVQFLHAGSLRNAQRDAGPFFEAFGRVTARTEPRLVLRLLGVISPEHEAAARNAIAADRLQIDGFVPHSDALRRMAAADVLVIVTSEREAGPATMTGKIFECLALRRPVLLVAPPGPAAELIEQSGAGLVADPNDMGGMEDAIVSAAQWAQDPTYRGARTDFIDGFDRRMQTRIWSALLTRVMGGQFQDSEGYNP